MEVGRNDALIARDRLLAEMVRCKDIETGKAMWRAAKKYNFKMRTERSGEIAALRPDAVRGYGV